MKKRYLWKELTDDGLMKEPEPLGPYYSQDSWNGFGYGYESIEEAEAKYEYMEKTYTYQVPYNMVLVTVYQKGESDER